MTDIKLSKRMQRVADMVESDSVADVGCDHAYVAMWLANKGKKVIAMDVKQGPLDIARHNVSAANLGALVEVRMSDGLTALSDNEVSAAVIAGMGGELIIRILDAGRRHLDNGISLVLQPQSEVHKVREYLLTNSYTISDEAMVYEDGKYYSIIKAEPGKCEVFYNDIELLYGRLLLERKDKVLKEYLLLEKDKLNVLKERLSQVYTETSAHRLEEIKVELLDIDRALQHM